MAFWGVEMKPGNPYKHQYNNTRRRLHVSQATLGSGQSTKKSITVQCNVGNKSPVLLCSLLPERIESCLLNLEFEEDEEVIFSVIGPRSVHLTGFYLERSSNLVGHGDDSESYGEDIADTETDNSSGFNSEDDKYESDFIDDGEPETVSSPSLEPKPQPKRRVRENFAKKASTTRRLQKRYQLSESSSDDGSQKEVTVKSLRSFVVESEDEVTPVCKASQSKSSVKNADAEQKSDKMIDNGMNENSKAELINKDGEGYRVAEHQSDSFRTNKVAAENGGETKKKRKEKKKGNKEEMAGQDQASDGLKSDVLDKSKTDWGEEDIVNKDVGDVMKKSSSDKDVTDPAIALETVSPSGNTKSKKKKKDRANDKIHDPDAGLSASLQVEAYAADSIPANNEPKIEVMDQDTIANGQELNAKPLHDKEVTDSRVISDNTAANKKKRSRAKDGALQPEVDLSRHDDNKQLNNGTTIEEMDLDLPVSAQENGKLLGDKSLDHDIQPFGADSQSEGKKKRKKKSKTCHGANVDESTLPLDEVRAQLVEKTDNQQEDQAHPLVTRTLPNGLVIEELSTGNLDGKEAEFGKKVSVHYIGKLKENGEVYSSTTGKKPFKFRLGKGEVIDGLEVGVAGMHVGEKRRLTIPPSLAYGAQGEGKIPGNVWVVFDVELVDVR